MIKGIILLIVSLGILSTPCTAQTIVIDGKLDDWGITDSELDSGLNSDDINSWIPDKCPNADWIVENDLAGDWGSDPVLPGTNLQGSGIFALKEFTK